MPTAARGSSAGLGNRTDQRGGCRSTFALSVLTHRGERGLHAAGDRVVVESDDRNVLGYA
jgi:hypothetical protein